MASFAWSNLGAKAIRGALRPVYIAATPLQLADECVYGAVSVVPKSPLLQPNAARSLLEYMAALPHPAVVLLADKLSRHNVAAFGHVRDPAVQLRQAMANAQPLWQALCGAHASLAPAQRRHVTLLRWEDVEAAPPYGAVLQSLTRMYECGHSPAAPACFKQFAWRVDAVGEAFVVHRLKDSRPVNSNGTVNKRHQRRVHHSAQYVLGELPLLLAGLQHEGRHHRLLLYAGTQRQIIESMAALGGVHGQAPRRTEYSLGALIRDMHTDPAMAPIRTQLNQSGVQWALPSIVGLPMS